MADKRSAGRQRERPATLGDGRRPLLAPAAGAYQICAVGALQKGGRCRASGFETGPAHWGSMRDRPGALRPVSHLRGPLILVESKKYPEPFADIGIVDPGKAPHEFSLAFVIQV